MLFRINRNIVECKWRGLKEGKDFEVELIETLWNVNVFYTMMMADVKMN